MKAQKITIDIDGKPVDLLVVDAVEEMPGRYVLAARDVEPGEVNVDMGEDATAPERDVAPTWAEDPARG